MIRYLVFLGVMALAAGALLRAAGTFQLAHLRMWATMGLFMIALFGTLVVQRRQSDKGKKDLEGALLGLGDGYIITDWSAAGPKNGPAYVVAGPMGLVAVCIDAAPNTRSVARQRRRLRKVSARARAASEWIRKNIAGAPGGAEIPLFAVVVLTRCRVHPDLTDLPVPVINPEHLQGFMAALPMPRQVALTERRRFSQVLRHTPRDTT